MAAPKEMYTQEYRNELVDKLSTAGLRDAAHQEQDRHLDQLKNRVDEIHRQDQQLGVELQNLLDKLQLDLTGLKSRSKDFKGPVLNYLKRLAELDKMIQAAEVTTAEQTITKETDTESAKHKNLETATQEVADLTAKQARLDSSVDTLRAAVAAADSDLKEAAEKVRLSNEAVTKKTAELNSLLEERRKIDAIELDPNAQELNYAGAVTNAKADMQRLETELAALRSQLETAADKHAAAGGERFSEAAHERELAKADHKIEDLEAEAKAMQDALDADIGGLQAAVYASTGEIAAKNAEIANAKQEASQALDDIKTEITAANTAVTVAEKVRASFYSAMNTVPPPAVSSEGTRLGPDDRANNRIMQGLTGEIRLAADRRDRLTNEAARRRKDIREDLAQHLKDIKTDLDELTKKQDAAADIKQRREQAVLKKRKEIIDAREEKKKLETQGNRRKSAASESKSAGTKKSDLEKSISEKEAALIAATADRDKNQAYLAIATSLNKGQSSGAVEKLDHDIAEVRRALDLLADQAAEDKDDMAEAADSRKQARSTLTKARAERKKIIDSDLPAAEAKVAAAKQEVAAATASKDKAVKERDAKQKKFEATPREIPQILKSREKTTVDIPRAKILDLIGVKSLDTIITMIAEGGAYEAKRVFADLFSQADLDALHEVVEPYGYDAGDFIDDWKTDLHHALFANLSQVVEHAWDKQVTEKINSLAVAAPKKSSGGLISRMRGWVGRTNQVEVPDPADPKVRLGVQKEYRAELEANLLRSINQDKAGFLGEMSRVLSQSLREATAKKHDSTKLQPGQGTDALAIAELRQRIDKAAVWHERSKGAKSAEVIRTEQTKRLDTLMSALTTEQDDLVSGFQDLIDNDPELIKDLSKLNISAEAAAIIEQYNRRALSKADLAKQLPALLVGAASGSAIEKALSFSQRQEAAFEIEEFRSTLGLVERISDRIWSSKGWQGSARAFLHYQEIPDADINNMGMGVKLARSVMAELRALRNSRILSSDISLSRQLDDFIYRIDKAVRATYFTDGPKVTEADRADQINEYVYLLESDQEATEAAEARLRQRIKAHSSKVGGAPNLRAIIGSKPKPKKK